ncbi:Acid sphingomyelinase-like phosphodiesterase 3b precursor [Enhygromyxa salina]|uniref:Acid sphingomyelinase-like phosphodiesterase 3b n=1 Tax=Enhygromyxa salina TaxID=215803 RepID=A0A0C1ZWE8_9BACT|nr:metallophosphoesterase [Enhygromyxa salina]KIG15383.1 Acid sphingomyelinase-like phosphodiesterase 3b precursor [Enhygromyxa salina]
MTSRVAVSLCLLTLSLGCRSGEAPAATKAAQQTEPAPQPTLAPPPAPPVELATGPATARFVSLSDLHFDPFLDPALVPKLAAAEAIEWGPLFEARYPSPGAASGTAGPATQLGSYGGDTPYPLLRSALAAPQHASGWPPDYVIISGDFLAHSFRSRYQELTGDDSDAGYRGFVDKTLQFLTVEINTSFPGIPIIPALGNNDSYCGDYLLEPGGTFLQMLAWLWAPLARGGPEFSQTFTAGGWYEVPHPKLEDHRLIVLNTVFFSTKYANSCAASPTPNAPDPTTDPTTVQLEWLAQRLAAAEAAGHKVSLIYHIPPGVNVYSAVHAKTPGCPQTSELFWRDEPSTAFLALVDQYHAIILASFAGHIHTDDFRLTYPAAKPDTPTGFIHVTPAISPLFGNNPGFQVFDYDPSSGALRDFTTYALPLGAAAPSWQAAYSFNAAYATAADTDSDYDLVALARTRARISTDPAVRAKYIAFNPVDNPDANQINADNWRTYWCATGTMTTTEFGACMCPEPTSD